MKKPRRITHDGQRSLALTTKPAIPAGKTVSSPVPRERADWWFRQMRQACTKP